MVAEGKYTAEQAQIAMIEKSSPRWDEAKQRVDMEAALRSPAGWYHLCLAAWRCGGGAQAFLPSMFGAKPVTCRWLEYRRLKQEWNDAWKLADAGDTTAVQRFFDNYPVYGRPSPRIRMMASC